jgi:serine/threonine protein kinase
VAIKFLPSHTTDNSEERRRFETEAQADAALNRLNITTIHAIEETDDNIFLIMEYIVAKQLKDRIKSKPLPINDTGGFCHCEEYLDEAISGNA